MYSFKSCHDNMIVKMWSRVWPKEFRVVVWSWVWSRCVFECELDSTFNARLALTPHSSWGLFFSVSFKHLKFFAKFQLKSLSFPRLPWLTDSHMLNPSRIISSTTSRWFLAAIVANCVHLDQSNNLNFVE